MILGSTNISTLKLGSSAVQKVMLGATEVWSAVDADFAAYLAAGIANGSTMSAANQAAVNAFIVGCKSDGIWSAIKASCILAAWDSLAGALTPLVGSAPTNYNFVSGDYSRTTGLVGNGSTKYLDSNRKNNDDPQDNQHISVFHNSIASIISAVSGAADGTGTSQLIARPAPQTRSRNTSGIISSGSVGIGLYGISRSDSSSYSWRANGGLLAGTILQNSEIPSAGSVAIFARGSGALPTANRLSFYSIGESIDLALLDARLTTLMAALT